MWTCEATLFNIFTFIPCNGSWIEVGVRCNYLQVNSSKGNLRASWQNWISGETHLGGQMGTIGFVGLWDFKVTTYFAHNLGKLAKLAFTFKLLQVSNPLLRKSHSYAGVENWKWGVKQAGHQTLKRGADNASWMYAATKTLLRCANTFTRHTWGAWLAIHTLFSLSFTLHCPHFLQPLSFQFGITPTQTRSYYS